MSLSRFFIDRPVFAWVIAVVIMLAGGIAAFSLPIEQYPTIAPPAVVISAVYPGADAESLQNSVTQVIEQQLTGLDNLLYFSSQSNADGTVLITATFAAGTNPDIAQVQVQNKVQAAVPLLPSAVQQLGVVVAKNTPNFIIVVGIYDDTGRYTNVDISDFITSKMQDPLSRVPGVGNTRVFGAQYAMRIWLDPYKLHNFNLQPSDVNDAIRTQNVQVSAGQIGAQPTTPGAAINATVTAQSRLQHPRTVPQHHPQDRAQRCGGAAGRCGAGRAGGGNLCHRQPVQRLSRRRSSPSCWRRGPMRSRPWMRSRPGRRN